MKDKLLEITRAHEKAITDLRKRVGRYTGARVQADSLLGDVRAVAAVWFDSVRPALEASGVGKITQGTDLFDKLLSQGKHKPRKPPLLANIADCLAFYRDLIHAIETSSFAAQPALSIAPYIEGLSTDEGEYLAEAQRCLDANALRGCVVLGWCATISRIHRKIEEIGFDKFSQATAEMNAKTTGRFKPFRKQFTIESRSELQTVFDTDLLWVLEYLEFIDNNQHQRLRHCFEFRNNSSHPGLAPIKGANLYSFYSDISEFVLKNPKFALA